MLKIARLQNLGAFKYDDPPTFVAMNTKDEKIAQFDPNGLAAPGALYGLPFDEVDATFYATIRHDLELQGQVIGPYDLQIAAICVRYGFVLVTNNVSEFSRVSGLTVQDWT